MKKIEIEGVMSYKDLERKHRLLDDLNEARDLKAKLISRGVAATQINNSQKHIDKLEKEIAKLP